MAFSSLASSLIAVGKAIKAEIFSTLKSNQDDLNTRLSTVEGSANKIVVFNGIFSNPNNSSTLTGIMFERTQASFTLTDAKLYIFDKGSLTGTLEFDVRKSTTADFTSDVSVFSTKPSIDFSTASSYDESANAVFDGANDDFVEGDYIRIDISSLPASGQITRFGIYLIGEAS